MLTKNVNEISNEIFKILFQIFTSYKISNSECQWNLCLTSSGYKPTRKTRYRFIHLFMESFIHLLILSFVESFIHWFIESFTESFLHSFIDHLLFHSSITSARIFLYLLLSFFLYIFCLHMCPIWLPILFLIFKLINFGCRNQSWHCFYPI
jgi:hypothetical protein